MTGTRQHLSPTHVSQQKTGSRYIQEQFAFAIDEKPITVIFSIASDAPAVVQSVTINGIEMEFKRAHNPYRPGGVRIPRNDVQPLLTDGMNHILVTVA